MRVEHNIQLEAAQKGIAFAFSIADYTLALAAYYDYLAILAATCRYNSIRSDVWVHRASLLRPQVSQWAHLKRAREDSAYITFLRVNVDVFYLICQHIPEEVWYRRRPGVRHPGGMGTGRELRAANVPFFLGADDLCALALVYMSSTTDQRGLQAIFGVTDEWGTTSEALDILLATLRGMRESRCSWPTKTQQYVTARTFIAVAQLKPGGALPPFQRNVMCLVDGTHCAIEPPRTDDARERVYYGKEGKHTVKLLAACDDTGLIVWYSGNHPGRTHDADPRAIGDLMRKLRDPRLTMRGYCALGDSGFCSGAFQPNLVTAEDVLPADATPAQRTRQAKWCVTVRGSPTSTSSTCSRGCGDASRSLSPGRRASGRTCWRQAYGCTTSSHAQWETRLRL